MCLGFLIDSCNVTATWPLAKRVELNKLVQTVLQSPNKTSTPKVIASIIGKIRSAARTVP